MGAGSKSRGAKEQESGINHYDRHDVSINLPTGCAVPRRPFRKSLAGLEELYRILAAPIIAIDEIKSKPAATSALLATTRLTHDDY
jgi:hypothetical protein